MRNFQLMQTGLDVLPLLHAVQRQPDLWNQNDLRREYPDSPQSEVDDIWLRFNETPDDHDAVMDSLQDVNYPAMYALPEARPFIFGTMSRVDGEQLGRVLITRLAPGKRIQAHVDGGKHAEFYDRYHVVLQGLPGCVFACGEEEVNMQTGEVWWFDSSQPHSVLNNSADDRIHLVVDIRTLR